MYHVSPYTLYYSPLSYYSTYRFVSSTMRLMKESFTMARKKSTGQLSSGMDNVDPTLSSNVNASGAMSVCGSADCQGSEDVWSCVRVPLR